MTTTTNTVFSAGTLTVRAAFVGTSPRGGTTAPHYTEADCDEADAIERTEYDRPAFSWTAVYTVECAEEGLLDTFDTEEEAKAFAFECAELAARWAAEDAAAALAGAA